MENEQWCRYPQNIPDGTFQDARHVKQCFEDDDLFDENDINVRLTDIIDNGMRSWPAHNFWLELMLAECKRTLYDDSEQLWDGIKRQPDALATRHIRLMCVENSEHILLEID